MDSGSVAVVGAGPAGLAAAELLAAAGRAVTVYDARRSVGRKFLLAGRSGLNLTNAEPLDELVVRFGNADPKLVAALRTYTPTDLRRWSDELGQPTFVGSSGRVFPEDLKATPLLRAWLARLTDLGVSFALEHRWTGWTEAGDLKFSCGSAHDPAGDVDVETVIASDAVVFALGGASWPRVSSGGTWASSFRAAGITVHELVASNCGVQVSWTDVLRDRFEGTPIKNVACTVAAGGIDDQPPVRGDIVITASGLEGGPIYALGSALRNGLSTSGTTALVLDTSPDLSLNALADRLSNRRPKASATSWLRSAGINDVVVGLAREATANQLPQDPAVMAGLLKQLRLPIDGMAAIDRAISTAGGVSFDELDDRFMLKQRPGTFVAGEMLDWDAPTGGYLLQACFSTGVAAARGVLAY